MSNGARVDEAAADGDEDDYMSMVFTDAPSAPETSLQRRERLRREGLQRGRVKSKAELAEEEAFKRETALATSLLDRAAAAGSGGGRSKGFAMMAKMGFKAGGALGPERQQGPSSGETKKEGVEGGKSRAAPAQPAGDEDTRLREPLRISVRADRGGVGLDSDRKRKLREAAEGFAAGVKRARADEAEFKDRVRRDNEVARLERVLRAAQKIAERMAEEEDEDEGDDGGGDSGTGEKDTRPSRRENRSDCDNRPPLSAVNVLWRGLVRYRENSERARRARHELATSLHVPGSGGRRMVLPTYDDGDEDDADRTALGKDLGGLPRLAAVVRDKKPLAVDEDEDGVYDDEASADDVGLDEDEDPELAEFEGRDVAERLQSVVDHLRRAHRYCFWCKSRYPDEEMDGCPGPTEEDHD